MFLKYFTGQIPPKKSRGKGSQKKKTADTPVADVDVSEESDSEPTRKRTASRRVVKKKVTISAADNIIPNLDVTLELGKAISLTKAAEEEAARKVHATHARIAIESILEPARRRPSGIAFRDTSQVSKKVFSDPSQKLKGVQSLTHEEQEAADTMKALKESKKTSRRHLGTKGQCEGTELAKLEEVSLQEAIPPYFFLEEVNFVEKYHQSFDCSKVPAHRISIVDIEKSHEDPHSEYNKDIVVENLVKFVENYCQSFDCNTGPD
ncbi:hypothetical protein Tco_0205935 [Tanacetum coccineum]